MKRTVDIKFLELCEEIDYWKEQADYYKQQYEDLLRENIESGKKRIEETQRGVANALLFALSVEDMPDGSLKINKENRKHLAKSIK